MQIAILACFLAALGLFSFGKLVPKLFAKVIVFLPLSLFVYFLSLGSKLLSGELVNYIAEWIPRAGVAFDFQLDGISYLFSLLITGVGTLVYFYAWHYFKSDKERIRFFTYLSLFMGSMLGLVCSNNLLLLFVFWEQTSITSFFLIGFNSEDKQATKSSYTALAITGGGGFFLLAGFVILGNLTGTYEISQLGQYSGMIHEHALYPVLVVFLFIGCFTKSAQFPFHFWLPGAMKAPTPVSAYLHSSTMVKAGIFLLAKFTPILGGHIYWNNTLMIVGGFTMVFAATQSVFKRDLKAILAYSTIAALGICTFLLGAGTTLAFVSLCVFLLTHALYKAGLFLTAGIIDQTAGTRDRYQLSGLRKKMVLLPVAALVAALSIGGVPFTLGFISKDLQYEMSLFFSEPINIIFVCLFFITNMFLIAAGFLAGLKPFSGQLPAQFSQIKSPNKWFVAPVLVLAFLTILFGAFPALVDHFILQPFLQTIQTGIITAPLALWHGFNLVLILSLSTLLVGFILYLIFRQRNHPSTLTVKTANWTIGHFTEAFSKLFVKLSFKYTRALHNGYLRNYFLMIIIYFIGLVGYKVVKELNVEIQYELLSEIKFYEVVFFVVIILAILITVFTPSRLTAIAGMGIVGYCICIIFVYYGAPDLAMTQFTIDTLTVVLFVLVLFRLPHFKKYINFKIQLRDGLIALSFGTLISLIALHAFNQPANKVVSSYFAENAYTLAKGKNVVNVILVDFRGFDTMVEIIVLTIAALGVYSLLKLNPANPEKE